VKPRSVIDTYRNSWSFQGIQELVATLLASKGTALDPIFYRLKLNYQVWVIQEAVGNIAFTN